MTKLFGSARFVRQIVRSALSVLVLLPAGLATDALGQTPLFTPGNLVVVVEGCGVQGGTCTTVPNGTGAGTGNSSVGGYGDNQAAPLTLFQFTPSGVASATYVNSLVLPQAGAGANLPIAGEYGSSSEGGLQLSGQGQYLTLGTYGINATIFNANPTTYGAAPSLALAQSGSLTGQAYTPVARVVTLIDPYGNVNSSSAIFNIFNTNNPRSVYTANGTTAYLSGQGASGDATGGVFYTPLGGVNNAPTAITGLDTTTNTVAQDTRFVTAYNGTLYVSVDSKGGSNNARSFVGTLGTPPATTLFNAAAGPTQLVSANNAATPASVSSAGKITLTASEANSVNASAVGSSVNLSPSGYFFANAYTLYIADTGNGKQTSATKTLGDGGLQKWINTKTDGTGTWLLMYTMSAGLNLVTNPATTPGNTTGTTGLYGLTGVVVGSNVYLYATNSTIADLDPTYLFGISDAIAATSNASSFTLLATAPADSNFKGVSFAPSLPAGSATINTAPEGLQITTAGAGCSAGTFVTPVTLVWTPGSACTLTTQTLQTVGASPYFFTQWQDNTTSGTDSVVAPSTSGIYTATFTNVVPTPVVSVGSGTIVAGTASTTLTANVAYTIGSIPAPGVSFTVNGSATGVGAVSCAGTTSPFTCTATYATAGLAAGSYPITAMVAASNTTLSAGGTGTLTVVPPPNFTVDNGSGSSTLAVALPAGTTSTGSLKLTSTFGFAGAVALACSGTGGTGMTCSVTPAVTLAAAGTGTATVTITTTGHTIASGVGAVPQSGRGLYMMLVMLLAAGALMMRGASRNVRAGGLLVLLLALVAGVSGCSSSRLNTSANPNGTPLGTYSYTVTATAGAVSHTETIAITVQ